MKIYEALKEMIEHGKTIKAGYEYGSCFRLGIADWNERKFFLEKKHEQSKWEVINSFWFSTEELSKEWEVVEETAE